MENWILKFFSSSFSGSSPSNFRTLSKYQLNKMSEDNFSIWSNNIFRNKLILGTIPFNLLVLYEGYRRSCDEAKRQTVRQQEKIWHCYSSVLVYEEHVLMFSPWTGAQKHNAQNGQWNSRTAIARILIIQIVPYIRRQETILLDFCSSYLHL